ncbi:DCL family protein [Actinomadura monticuli]|uniref:DCL family protein n=1 Tax=Actinomadura monticuli TaxID=3097367 RepID=A0ABV4Q6A3_9ACTN
MAKVWVGATEYPSKSAVQAKCREILAKYPGDPNAVPAGSERIAGPDDVEFIEALIASHPDVEEKIGVGIDHFEVRYYDYGTRAVCLVRIDGSDTDISLPWAVKHLPTSPPR